ncbi:MAG: hypothetical protein HY659_14740 [Rhizobiales bacterium]|nr:hypothetical protein [Hyphomicrobiales bacterium]
MNQEARHRVYGTPMSEWIARVPNEMPRDAVGLWQIVPAGRRGFGLDGADLVDFVRRCLHALVEHGAKPVIGGGGTNYEWIYQPQYGQSNSEIVENVIAEWLASGGGDTDPGGLWFALPEMYQQKIRR